MHNLRRHSISHLRAHLRFSFREHLKMNKNVKKKIHFTLQLMEGTFDGAPKDALGMMGACEVALGRVFFVSLSVTPL